MAVTSITEGQENWRQTISGRGKRVDRFDAALAMAIDPNLGIAAGNLAWVYLQQGGDLDVALGLAQKGKQLMPQMPAISDTLGWVMYKKRMYSNALSLFEECVSQAPQSAQFHYHLGMTLLASGQSSKAKDHMVLWCSGKAAPLSASTASPGAG